MKIAELTPEEKLYRAIFGEPAQIEKKAINDLLPDVRTLTEIK